MTTQTNPWAPRHLVPAEHVAAAAHYFEPPDPSRKAWAVVSLSFRPHTSGFTFEPGDEVQDVLPADVVRAAVERGEISYEEPAK